MADGGSLPRCVVDGGGLLLWCFSGTVLPRFLGGVASVVVERREIESGESREDKARRGKDGSDP
jgi:hypothetical protein